MRNFAHLRKDCPFYDLFENGSCPIINIAVPNLAELETPDGVSTEEVYMVDLLKLSDAQLVGIAQRIARKAGANMPTVLNEIREHGLPLRVSQTTGCSTDVPFFL